MASRKKPRKRNRMTQTEALADCLDGVFDHDPSLLTWQEDVVPTSYSQFQPRPNRPEVFDEQLAFFDSKDQVAFLIGGNACLHESTLIDNPDDGTRRAIGDIAGSYPVWSVTRHGQCRSSAVAAWRKPSKASMARVVLSDGLEVVGSEDHRVLALRQGGIDQNRLYLAWLRLADVLPGTFLVRASIPVLPQENEQPARLCRICDRRCSEGGYAVQCTANEKRGQDWVWTCHVPGSNNYASSGVFHHNSGTTESAVFKLAQFVLHQQEAPRKDTPFWIISNTYEQVCGTIWLEKLVGHGHIPRTEINERRIRWMSEAAQWPFTVPLLPWKNGDQRHNWMLEFKSYEQGRRALQARSIGGFFFSEQFPLDVFLETLRGCREYMYPGAQFAEFTPIEPDLCMWVEKLMEKPPPGWGFYRANTAENRVNLADGWFDQFFAAVPDELLQTRLTGQLATYEGVIYEAFNPKVHIVGDDVIDPHRNGVFHYRGVDWGASVEHPFCCLWAYRDGIGDWHVYDEYWNPRQNMTGLDHIAEINSRWPWPESSLYHGRTYADPSRPDMFNLFNQFGIPTQPGMNDVYKGIDTVRSLLQVRHETGVPKLFIHGGRCPHLCEEMRKYRWLRGIKPGAARSRNPRTARAVPLKRDDDTCDALRYMVHTVESTQGVAISSARYKEQDTVHRAVQLALGNVVRDQAWNRKPTAKTIPQNTRFKPLLRPPTSNGNGNNGNGNR